MTPVSHISPSHKSRFQKEAAFVAFYLESEEFFEFRLIVTNNHIVINPNNGNAHLASHVDHFFALIGISRDIMFGIGHLMLVKKFFGGMTKMTDGGAINGNSF
jgi:hypothetical protein